MDNKFCFTGTLVVPDAQSRRRFVRSARCKTGQPYQSMHFGIEESKDNMVFVQAFDTKMAVIKTVNQAGSTIEIRWDDRLNQDVIKNLASFRKYTVDLGEAFGGRQVFATQYDMILFLKEHLPRYQGKVRVEGRYVKEWYNDKFNDLFRFECVFAVSETTASRLSLTMDVYYRGSNVIKDDYEKDGRINVNGMILQYLKAKSCKKFLWQVFTLDASDFSDARKELFEFNMQALDVEGLTIYHMLWEVELRLLKSNRDSGEMQLSTAQKRLIEITGMSPEDFKPSEQTDWKDVFEYRLKMPLPKGPFTDGPVSTGVDYDDLYDMVYDPQCA